MIIYLEYIWTRKSQPFWQSDELFRRVIVHNWREYVCRPIAIGGNPSFSFLLLEVEVQVTPSSSQQWVPNATDTIFSRTEPRDKSHVLQGLELCLVASSSVSFTVEYRALSLAWKYSALC